jgi:hypothetical protein
MNCVSNKNSSSNNNNNNNNMCNGQKIKKSLFDTELFLKKWKQK